MRSPLPSAERQQGFTLIELMVGVLIGLLASLAVTQVLVNFEAQKRTISSGSDAQVSGALALDLLQRSVQSSGYGFAANPGALGCTIRASFGGAAVAGFPSTLAPVLITDGASGAPDSIQVLSSGKRNFALPLRINSPGAEPAANPTTFPLASAIGVETGDLLIAVRDGLAECDLLQASAVAGTTVSRTSGADWNQSWQTTGTAITYSDGTYVVNLGVPSHRLFSISNDSLRLSTLQSIAGAPFYTAANEVFSGIINLQAQYGLDTDADGNVETWNNITPVGNAQWRQVLAIRLAVVARSTQYEKDVVTAVCPTWEGTLLRIPASPGACSSYPNSNDEEWKHYRYRVFETVVPLRNLLWSS